MSQLGAAPGAFAEVVKDLIYRSAQPSTPAGWDFICALGVTHVVKLNAPSEGSDDAAAAAGLIVHNLAIQPVGSGSLVQQLADTLVRPDLNLIQTAVALLDWSVSSPFVTPPARVLVHCTHGQDRTGLVVGLFRVRVQGWSTDEAWYEMVAMGYHPELVGLDRAFLELGEGL